jgi:hypothetical protein
VARDVQPPADLGDCQLFLRYMRFSYLRSDGDGGGAGGTQYLFRPDLSAPERAARIASLFAFVRTPRVLRGVRPLDLGIRFLSTVRRL